MQIRRDQAKSEASQAGKIRASEKTPQRNTFLWAEG